MGRTKGAKDKRTRKKRPGSSMKTVASPFNSATGGSSVSAVAPAACIATLNTDSQVDPSAKSNTWKIPESLQPHLGWTKSKQCHHDASRISFTVHGKDKEYWPDDIVAELDDDDQHEDKNAAKGSVMGIFLHAVSKRLQEEVRGKGANEKWLMQMIKDGDWRLSPRMAETICNKLGLDYGEPSYYRAIHVWLPDERWGAVSMPPCVNCKSADKVSPHDFPHAARRVLGVDTHYYLMAQRYICHTCEGESKKAKNQHEMAAASHNLRLVDNVTTSCQQYTFMGYDPLSVALLPHGHGMKYPAFHMHKSAVCKKVIKMLRPLLNAGCRPNRISNILLELHSLRYFEDYIEREHKLRENKSGLFQNTVMTMFSSFGDKNGYDGRVPTGRYIECVYKKYMESIMDHLNNEVKKRGAQRLHWDASYKEAKHLGQFHGKAVFRALITATNEVGEIRVQFHVVTDGHDQMEAQIAALLETLRLYGQPMPELLTTDNPSGDKQFFLKHIPSLERKQRSLDLGLPVLQQSKLKKCTVDIDKEVKVCRNLSIEANRRIIAIRNLVTALPLKQQIISIDIEWDLYKNAGGFITGQGMTALLQLSYRACDNGPIKALLLQTNGDKQLNNNLLELLADQRITIVGRGINGDMARLARDFDCAQKLKHVNIVDIGAMARARNVVSSAAPQLAHLVEILLEEDLDKTSGVRVSDKWSAKQLSSEQIQYGALDVIKGLEIYFKLDTMPDINTPLSLHEATAGRVVSIKPSSKASMTTCAATAIIEPRGNWLAPGDKCKPMTLKATDSRCLVTITKVYAESLVVPNIKRKDGKSMTLGDFGDAPFTVMLPLRIVISHIETAPCETLMSNAQESSVGVPVGSDGNSVELSGESNMGDIVDENCLDLDADEAFGTTRNDFFDEHNSNYDDVDKLCDDYEDFRGLTPAEISRVRAAVAAGESRESVIMSEHLKKMLGDIPENIVDRYSSVLGDIFHFMDRCKVSIHHEAKKGYFVALRQAFLQWDPVKLAEVVAVLRDVEGKSDTDIEAMMYYNVDYFRQRVPRIVLPPSQLYHRVRAVFEVYGPAKDSETGAPLFNGRAWKTAKNVLKEILAGHASDPPGISFYSYWLTRRGDLAYDSHGIALLDCSRGSNDTESAHKQLISTFGSRITGVKMADFLMAEWRHRHNQGVSERKRIGFPRIGHYDTWLVDHLQKLVERNHGILIYPNWSNASDYAPTAEQLGTVPIHSEQLATAIDNISLSKPLSEFKFTEDQEYLCEKMKTKVPLLPVNGKEECQLFNAMVDRQGGKIIDFEEMAIAWCDPVDGENIFPKLAVYLRTHYNKWIHNRKVQDCVARLATGEARLRELNESFTACNATNAAVAASDGNNDSTTNAPALANDAFFISKPPTMPQPPDSMLRPEGEGVAVGGTIIGGVSPTRESGNAKRKNGERGKDGQKRSLRRCKLCVQHKKCDDDAVKCPGSQAAGTCNGGMNGASLNCIHCNSSTKCNCSINKKKKQS